MSAPSGKLLVVYDGSSMADRALDAALERARKDGEHVTLVSPVPARLWRAKQGQFPTSLDEHDEEFARRQLARGTERCKHAGVSCDDEILIGPMAEVIAQKAALGYDAVYVGERRGAASRPSLPALLRRMARCDVVAVP